MNVFKKYGTSYDLLENLVSKKTTVNSANADQISFIINLMNGYNESKLIDIKAIKDEFFYNIVLTKSKEVFLDTKKNSKKSIRSLLPHKFREYISNKEKDVLLNTMNLYNGRNKIIKLFESEDITPSMYAYDAKSEPEIYAGVKRSEQKSVENIGGRVKLRKQKSDEFNKIITKKDEVINRELFKNYFHQFESLSDTQKKLSKTQNA